MLWVITMMDDYQDLNNHFLIAIIMLPSTIIISNILPPLFNFIFIILSILLWASIPGNQKIKNYTTLLIIILVLILTIFIFQIFDIVACIIIGYFCYLLIYIYYITDDNIEAPIKSMNDTVKPKESPIDNQSSIQEKPTFENRNIIMNSQSQIKFGEPISIYSGFDRPNRSSEPSLTTYNYNRSIPKSESSSSAAYNTNFTYSNSIPESSIMVALYNTGYKTFEFLADNSVLQSDRNNLRHLSGEIKNFRYIESSKAISFLNRIEKIFHNQVKNNLWDSKFNDHGVWHIERLEQLFGERYQGPGYKRYLRNNRILIGNYIPELEFLQPSDVKERIQHMDEEAFFYFSVKGRISCLSQSERDLLRNKRTVIGMRKINKNELEKIYDILFKIINTGIVPKYDINPKMKAELEWVFGKPISTFETEPHIKTKSQVQPDNSIRPRTSKKSFRDEKEEIVRPVRLSERPVSLDMSKIESLRNCQEEMFTLLDMSECDEDESSEGIKSEMDDVYRPEVNVDQTTKNLLPLEESGGSTNILENNDSIDWVRFQEVISQSHLKLLNALLNDSHNSNIRKEIADEYHTMEELLISDINEKAMDIIQDFIIEDGQLVEEYRIEIEKIIGDYYESA